MNVIQCENCGRKNRVPAAARGTARCAQCHQPLTWITEADDHSFAEVADAGSLPVLVDVWAPWCGPCRMVSPVLDRLAHELAGRVKLVKVNADTAPGVVGRFSAQGIPTLLLMRRGQVVARQTGASPEPALRAWLEHALADSAAAPTAQG